jgi:hypothetical protein
VEVLPNRWTGVPFNLDRQIRRNERPILLAGTVKVLV